MEDFIIKKGKKERDVLSLKCKDSIYECITVDGAQLLYGNIKKENFLSKMA